MVFLAEFNVLKKIYFVNAHFVCFFNLICWFLLIFILAGFLCSRIATLDETDLPKDVEEHMVKTCKDVSIKYHLLKEKEVLFN